METTETNKELFAWNVSLNGIKVNFLHYGNAIYIHAPSVVALVNKPLSVLEYFIITPGLAKPYMKDSASVALTRTADNELYVSIDLAVAYWLFLFHIDDDLRAMHTVSALAGLYLDLMLGEELRLGRRPSSTVQMFN